MSGKDVNEKLAEVQAQCDELSNKVRSLHRANIELTRRADAAEALVEDTRLTKEGEVRCRTCPFWHRDQTEGSGHVCEGRCRAVAPEGAVVPAHAIGNQGTEYLWPVTEEDWVCGHHPLFGEKIIKPLLEEVKGLPD